MLKIYLALFLLCFMFSCEDGDINSNSGHPNFVTLEDAKKIASVQAPLNTDGTAKSLGSTLEVKPDSRPTSYYIINYEGGGFILLAADKRIDPILAYSKDSPFPFEEKKLPEGLLNWMEGVHETIQEIRKENPEQGELLANNWKKIFTERHSIASTNQAARTETTWYEGDCNNGDSGYQQITHVDPFIVTTWDQGSGYNNLFDYGGCSQTSNGKYPAGCVPVAMTQVMRFWQYPSGYDWSTMLAGDHANDDIRRLIHDVAMSLPVTQGCDGTSAHATDVPKTFSSFGYKSATYASYNYFTATDNDIQNGRPALLGGYRSTDWWIFGAQGGHLWVGDGMHEIFYYSCQADPNTPGEWIAVYTGYSASVHMNWGWRGLYNGYYSSYNFNPGSRTYNVKQEMIYNIRRP